MITVPGVVFIATNSFIVAGIIPSASWARDAACNIARDRLRASGQAGTVAYAIVRPSNVVVFEDFGDLS